MNSTDSNLIKEGSGEDLHKPGLLFPSRPTTDEYYNVDFPKKALVIVFNHNEYMNDSIPRRDGSDRDVEKLIESFGTPDFEVRDFKDLTSHEIRIKLDELASENHSAISCLIVVIMTHGDTGGRLHTFDSIINVDDLWHPFTGDACLSLIGKPKLFFIQACRGQMVDPGALLESPNYGTNSLASRSSGSESNRYVVPALADILIFFSTTENYYSYKCPEAGSWFIQTLCDKFVEYLQSGEEIDLMRILIAVNRHVAFSFQAYNPGDLIDGCKQMPSITSMLTKILIFNKK